MLKVDVEKNLKAFHLASRFECESSGVIALFGRSGAGKSSIVNMLSGLLSPDRGHIAIRDRVLFDSDQGINVPPQKRRLGYVFQEDRLFPHLSVRGNLLYGWNRAPREDRRIQLEQVVTLLGIEPLLERRPGRLSGGEKQRVALGRALLANPSLLLMDEPLAALDQARKEDVLPFIERLRDDFEVPIIYVSHSMEEIVRLADTMVLISDGQVEAVGAVDDIMGRLDLRPLTGRYEAGAVIAAQISSHDHSFGLTELQFGGGTLRIPLLDMPTGTLLRLRIRARDVSLALRPPNDISIQNVFKATIVDIGSETGPQVDLRLDAGGAAVWARITKRALVTLKLEPGREVYAMVKAIAVDRHSLGRVTGSDRFLSGN
ncbi:molybdenum ABC transporter ATP-binding protein [Pelagibius sp. Alg239-R121]|uniref:molybdenum ABC transporter ATP-binding protein n=1 Tax=Pelagibius sp. Alg239-R121 TaxID=2993448 RepID=UPI0024A72A93|nr:molybdenum ABC transporter ATP-binding protein [Pelagibius sp. Alg239-R121]